MNGAYALKGMILLDEIRGRLAEVFSLKSYKIDHVLHGAIGSAATIGLLYWQPLGWALWICAVAVGWARVRTRNHTPLQVLAGLGCATLVVLVAFGMFGLRG